MSKKAKSEKRRKTVTFPSLFRMSTFVDIFRHMSTDAENRFEFLRFQKYSKMPRQLLVICDRWYRHGAQFGIEMFMDKGSILPVVAARKRVRTTVRKRHLSDSQEESKNLENRKKIILHLYLTSSLSLEGANYLGSGFSMRKGNVHRDRISILIWSKNLDDLMFARQFRLCRDDFYFVLQKISSELRVNSQQARNSSGSAVSPELMLMITLRILAGASYLDMIHYRVHVDSVNKIVWATVCAIHLKLDNIKMATTEAECKKLARVWSDLQKKRWGEVLTGGTIYAGDGLIIEIMQPDIKALRGRPIQIFRNRKGIWAVNVQGFCDGNAKFHVFDVKWPGGTNDIVAYNMTDLCHKARGGVHFPSWAYFMLDEAYGSIGGMHLTPYTLCQLRYAKKTDIEEYFKLLAFNNVLSSQS